MSNERETSPPFSGKIPDNRGISPPVGRRNDINLDSYRSSPIMCSELRSPPWIDARSIPPSAQAHPEINHRATATAAQSHDALSIGLIPAHPVV